MLALFFAVSVVGRPALSFVWLRMPRASPNGAPIKSDKALGRPRPGRTDEVAATKTAGGARCLLRRRKVVNLNKIDLSALLCSVSYYSATIIISVIVRKLHVKRAKIPLEPKWFDFLANVLLVCKRPA